MQIILPHYSPKNDNIEAIDIYHVKPNVTSKSILVECVMT